jgi:hypothetical protein
MGEKCCLSLVRLGGYKGTEETKGTHNGGGVDEVVNE